MIYTILSFPKVKTFRGEAARPPLIHIPFSPKLQKLSGFDVTIGFCAWLGSVQRLGYGTEGPGFESGQEQEIFFSEAYRGALWLIEPTIQRVLEFFPEVKRSELEVNH